MTLTDQDSIQLRLQALEFIARRPQVTGADATVLPIAQYLFDAEDIYQFIIKSYTQHGGAA